MRQKRQALVQLMLIVVLAIPVLAGAEPISSDFVSPLMRDADEITQPLDPAAARDCGAGTPAGEAGSKLKSCPAFARDHELGYVPANWGVALTGADLMSALPDVQRTSSRTDPGSKACVIDTGLRLQNNPGAGSDLIRQNTGQDTRGHGTHVAGIVSSSAHGVNPALKTVVLSTPQMTETELAQRLDEAATNPEVGVINLSFAISDGRELTSAIRRATEAGKWVVIAAGNRGVVNDTDATGLPEVEDLPGVFIVGANSPAAGMPSHFSNHGPHVDFYAPGSQIDSLNARANPGYIPEPGNVHLNGTSMAAPHATAVIATLKNLDPRLTSEEVKLIIEETGIRRGPPPGVNQLNPLLATEAVRRMSSECPGVIHGSPATAVFRDCAGKAIQSVQAAEAIESLNPRDFSAATCEELESEYARLRRAYFISRGGAVESGQILKFLAPLGRPAPPSAAEIVWFTPATPTPGDTEAIQAWTSEITRKLNQARAINPLSHDLIHALDMVSKYTNPPSALTPSERLTLLPARKESIGTFVEICTPQESNGQKPSRYIAYPCSDFFRKAPLEFKEAFYRALESQILDASLNNGVAHPFLESVSTDELWLSEFLRVGNSEPTPPGPLLDYLSRRSSQESVPDANALFWIKQLELRRTTPAPQGSAELNQALIQIERAGNPRTATERQTLQNNLRAILAICERNPAECRSKVGGPDNTPGSNISSAADQNITKYQDALREAILSDPTLAKEISDWLGLGDNLASFQSLFGVSSPLVPAILLAQNPDDIIRSTKIAKDWFAAVEKSIAGGSYCAAGTIICQPAAVIADQMELIAGKSPTHARLMRDIIQATHGRVVSSNTPSVRFRTELRTEIADSSELTSKEARKDLIRSIQRKYRTAGSDQSTNSSALRDEAGPLLRDPAILPIYVDLMRRELRSVSSAPRSDSAEQTIRTALQLSSDFGKTMIEDTLDALFARAEAGVEDYLGNITSHFGTLARDHSQDRQFLRSWFTHLTKHQRGIDSAPESQVFVTAAFELAQTEAGSRLMQNDPEFLSEWTRAFKRSEISGYTLTQQNKDFPDVLIQSLASSLPDSEKLARIDLESPENGWIKTVFQSGMGHGRLLDIAIAAYGKCPDDSPTKISLRQAIAEGLRRQPARISAHAGIAGILARDPDLRYMIWGELETSGGTVR